MRISDWSSDVCSSDLYTLLRLLGAIKSRTGLRVQTGGGVRKRSDVERLLAAGADRVVVGSIAVEMPAWVASWLNDYGSQCLTVALAVRETTAPCKHAITAWPGSVPLTSAALRGVLAPT